MDDIVRLKEKMRLIIDELRKNGVPEYEIEKLLAVDKPLSRIAVTKGYKILLPDYKKEIKLEPLHKAIYLLFLRHPEGIRFKEISDYKDELADIYRSMKINTQARHRVEKSIADVTDPLNHSIHEKCARINSIFKKELGEKVAKHYQILGQKGEKRTIGLDRDLVLCAENGKP